VVLGFFSDDSLLKQFTVAGYSLRRLPFGLLLDSSLIRETETIDAENFVVIYKNFDEGKAFLLAPFQDESILTFLSVGSLPIVSEFLPETSDAIFGGTLENYMILFIDNAETPESKSLLETFSQVASEYRGQVIFLFAAVSLKSSSELCGYLDIDSDSVPTIRFFNINSARKFIPPDNSNDADSWKEFVDSVLDETALPFYKSQEPVPYSGTGVRVLVGTDHDEIVNDPTKTVFVEYYAPWCGHCQALEPEWEQLANMFDSTDDVVIAKLDATENELSSVSIEGFPTLFLYKRGQPKEIIQYDDTERDLASLLNFLEPHLADSQVPEEEFKEEL